MMDCPRWGVERELNNKYCAWCGWDFVSKWQVCERCGNTIKDADGYCDECDDISIE